MIFVFGNMDGEKCGQEPGILAWSPVIQLRIFQKKKTGERADGLTTSRRKHAQIRCKMGRESGQVQQREETKWEFQAGEKRFAR